MAVLIESLKDDSHVVYRVSCAISHLATGFQGSEGGLCVRLCVRVTLATHMWCTE